MINWTLEKRKLSELQDNPKNPRKLSKEDGEQLQISLEKFGMADKIIINQDGTIIGGHQRKKILKKMGIKEIDCWIPDRPLTDKESDELNIRLNRNIGEWDFDILANEWKMEDLVEWGFDTEEFGLPSIEEIMGTEDESEVFEPGKDEEAQTKLGDVYELNEHRLCCGDSTLPEYVEKCLKGAEPILMVTDPPYGVEYDPSWRTKVKGSLGHKFATGKVQNDGQINWAISWSLFPGSVAYIWHAGKYGGDVQKSLTDCDYEIINQIIWVKQNFVFGRGDYHWQHEPCLYAVKKGHQHNWNGDRKQSTTWEISNLAAFGKSKEEDERTSHSTQKPIECMARPIRNNTAQREGVYDPFLGSGTTLIAAEQLSRICYGIELSPAYCDIIVQRWINYMQKNNKTFKVKKNGEPCDFGKKV